MFYMSCLNKTCFFLLIFFFFNSAFSQKIIVIDSESGKSISNMTVFGKKSMKSMISDKNGNLELDIFSSNDTLVFGHLSYDNLITQKKSIKGSVVSLNPAAQALKEVILSVARSRESKEKISKNRVKKNWAFFGRKKVVIFRFPWVRTASLGFPGVEKRRKNEFLRFFRNFFTKKSGISKIAIFPEIAISGNRNLVGLVIASETAVPGIGIYVARASKTPW